MHSQPSSHQVTKWPTAEAGTTGGDASLSRPLLASCHGDVAPRIGCQAMLSSDHQYTLFGGSDDLLLSPHAGNRRRGSVLVVRQRDRQECNPYQPDSAPSRHPLQGSRHTPASLQRSLAAGSGAGQNCRVRPSLDDSSGQRLRTAVDPPLLLFAPTHLYHRNSRCPALLASWDPGQYKTSRGLSHGLLSLRECGGRVCPPLNTTMRLISIARDCFARGTSSSSTASSRCLTAQEGDATNYKSARQDGFRFLLRPSHRCTSRLVVVSIHCIISSGPCDASGRLDLTPQSRLSCFKHNQP